MSEKPEVHYQGYWWLPAAPNTQVHGTLSWDRKNDAILQLDGSLEDSQGSQLLQLASPTRFGSYDLVLGLTADGTKMTCLNCMGTGRSIRLGGDGYSTERFVTRGALVGLWVEADNAPQFTSFTATLDHLTDWIPATGSSFEVSADESGRLRRHVHAYEPPGPQAEGPFGRASVTIGLTMAASGSRRERTLRETGSVTFDFADAVTPWDAEGREIAAFQRLLTTASLHSCPLTSISVSNGSAHGASGLWLTSRFPAPTEAESASELYEHQVFFTLGDVPPDQHPRLLARWAELADTYYLTLGVLAEDIGAPVRTIDSRLLLLGRAVESLHRRWRPPSEGAMLKNAQDIEQLNRDIKAPKLRRRVVGMMKRGYEPSLNVRLRELCEEVGPSVADLIPVAAAFADEFSAVRNDLTHESVTPAINATPMDQYRLVMQCRTLLLAWFAVQVGFTATEVGLLLKRNAEYRHWAEGPRAI